MRILAALLLSLPTFAVAAQQNCLCTVKCTLVGDPYPAASGLLSCDVYKGGALFASGPAVLSSTIPLSNAATCAPASAAYVPGPAGSLACAVDMTLPAGPYVFTMTADTAAGPSGQSGNISIQSVAVLPTVLPAPVNPRIK